MIRRSPKWSGTVIAPVTKSVANWPAEQKAEPWDREFIVKSFSDQVFIRFGSNGEGPLVSLEWTINQ